MLAGALVLELIKPGDDIGCHRHCLNEYKWNVRFNVLMVLDDSEVFCK